jgi:triosephosphate isomerase
MPKNKIIIANWKMNPTSEKEAEALFAEIVKKNKFPKTEVVFCPPYVYLKKISHLLKTKKYKLEPLLGAQNLFYEERGAFTGEISASMLADLGVKYVLVGHSERRQLGESNQEVNKKVKAALFFGLRPIVCVGESERDPEHGYFAVVKNQIEECLEGLKKEFLPKIIIAYEPIWAISTTAGRKDATPADSREMVIFIKKTLADKFGRKTKIPRILYGGSVDPKNSGEFLSAGGVDGALVGGASLHPEKFLKILEQAEK